MAEGSDTAVAATPINSNTPTLPNINSSTSKVKSKITENTVFPAPQTINGKRRIVCPIEGCTKSYGKTCHLRGHLIWHSGEKPFKCDHPTCNKAFTRSDELTRHSRTHTGERPHECPYCSKKFYRSDHLNKHISVHFKDPRMDISHLLDVSIEKESGNSTDAGQESKDRKSSSQMSVELEEHVKQELDTDGDDDEDRLDEKHLISEIKIELGMISETSMSVFNTSQESTTKTDELSNSKHKNILSREEDVKQEVDTDAECNNRFDEKDVISEIKIEPEMISEISIPAFYTSHGSASKTQELNQLPLPISTSKIKSELKSTEKRHKCDEEGCGKTFKRQDELKRHSRIHSGVKPFECDQCDKRFLRKDHLNKHLKTHTRIANTKGAS